MYDLIVIGAGPGGYEAAAHAGRMGKKVALVERDRLGGVCLNAGCIPAKTFLRSSRLFAECKLAGAYGVCIPGGLAFDMRVLVERKNRIVAALGKDVAALLRTAGVEVIQGHAALLSPRSVQVGDGVHEAANILLATGSRPAAPPIPGLDSPAVVDSTAMLDMTAVPKSLAVIGGGSIGLEFANFYSAIGVEVTVLEMLPRIAESCDGWIARRLQQALERAGARILTSCRVTGIDGGMVHYEGAGGARGSLAAEVILNAAGRAPALEGLCLERAGVDTGPRGIRTSDEGKTNVPGVWACGDVTGRRLLAHAATREGIVAVNNMFGKRDRIRYDAVPRVIYTSPEVAGVGSTEEELMERGVEYRKSVVPIGVAGRFLVEYEGGSGAVKVLVGARYGEILGVHAIGGPAAEFIVAAGAMIETEMCAEDAARLVYPHPTVAEALKAALAGAAR